MTNQTWRTDDQAAELRALRAENERLREMLERIVQASIHHTETMPGCPTCEARAALAKDSTKGEK